MSMPDLAHIPLHIIILYEEFGVRTQTQSRSELSHTFLSLLKIVKTQASVLLFLKE